MSRLSYRQLIRQERDFRKLWLGDVSSFIGDWFNLIAIIASVQAITDSKLAISGVIVAKTLPNFLMIPIAGPLVDRFDRRRLLLVCDFARALCVLGLIASHLAESLAGLLAFTFVMICFTGIAFPAKKSVLPMVVPREHIGIANALLGGTWSIMLAFGSALGGISVQYLGITASFAIDGVTFLISAMFFFGLPKLIPPAAEAGEGARLIDALRYLRRAPQVLALTCIKPFGSVPNAVVLVVIPLYGTIVFPGQGGPLYMGALYAARGAGAAFGSLALRVVFGDHPRTARRLIAAGYVLILGALTIVAQADAFWLAAFGFFLSALGSGGNWVFSGTLLQLEADPRYHGRVFSLEFGVTTMILAGGGMLVGLAMDYLDVSVAGVTQWWALLAIPGLLFWAGTLMVMRSGKWGIDR